DGDVGKRLVVAEADVERRPVALDEVLLEVQSLHLVLGDDHLDVLDALGKLPDSGSGVEALLEVRAHARPERLGLSDVQHVALLVAEEIDARLRRQRPQPVLEPLRHTANLAVCAATTCVPGEWHRRRLVWDSDYP